MNFIKEVVLNQQTLPFYCTKKINTKYLLTDKNDYLIGFKSKIDKKILHKIVENIENENVKIQLNFSKKEISNFKKIAQKLIKFQNKIEKLPRKYQYYYDLYSFDNIDLNTYLKPLNYLDTLTNYSYNNIFKLNKEYLTENIEKWRSTRMKIMTITFQDHTALKIATKEPNTNYCYLPFLIEYKEKLHKSTSIKLAKLLNQVGYHSLDDTYDIIFTKNIALLNIMNYFYKQN